MSEYSKLQIAKTTIHATTSIITNVYLESVRLLFVSIPLTQRAGLFLDTTTMSLPVSNK